MAAGGENLDPDPDLDLDLDGCSVCLEPFREPRFLPCHHTFCAACIEDVARHFPGAPFPCPQCRKRTTLPPGGVKDLQTNFYVLPKKTSSIGVAAAAPDTRPVCREHNERLKYFCDDCQEPVCSDCRLKTHKDHPAQDLQVAIMQKREEVGLKQDRIRAALTVAQRQLVSKKQERHLILIKEAELKRIVEDRHAEIVRQKEEVLSHLQSATEDILHDFDNSLKQREAEIERLTKSQEELDDTVSNAKGVDFIGLAKQHGNVEIEDIEHFLSVPKNQEVFDYPVLSDVISKPTRQQLTQAGVFGTIMSAKLSRAEVEVVKKFKCGRRTSDIRVFALCHVDGDKPHVVVTYEKYGYCKETAMRLYGEDGTHVRSEWEVGKMSVKRCVRGLYVNTHLHVAGDHVTYNKGATDVQYALHNDSLGEARITQVMVTSLDPLKVDYKPEFSVNITGLDRAFDVDLTEESFVVVDEARKVLMYRRAGGDPVATYTPPTPTFQPSDVCFYTLGGQQVLLVSDEANDAIHVVRVGEKTFTFLRYLTSECPLLVQPTAMNVDAEGRLWVACKAGNIIAIQTKW